MRSVIGAGCCLSLMLLSLQMARADEPAAVPNYFPSQVGNQWHYVVDAPGSPQAKISTKVAKIEKIDDQRLIRLETITQGKVVASEHLAADATGLYRHRIQGIESDPPVCIIKFPVMKGASWDTDSTVGPEKVSGKTTLQLEDVTVPAGTFKTVAVTMDMKTGAQRIDSTMWYADNVGMVQQTIKIDGGNEISLKLEKFDEVKAADK